MKRTWVYSFGECESLAVVIAPQEIPMPITSDTFSGSGKNVSGGMKIYVPDASVETYKKATNWIQYANRIYPMSELPEESQT